MLSFIKNKSSIPISTIYGGQYDNKTLYLSDEIIKNNVIEQNPMDYIDESIFYDKQSRRKVKASDINNIVRALEKNKDVIGNEKLVKLFEKSKKKIENNLSKEIILQSGEMQFLPSQKNPKGEVQRHVIYISGMSGSGKSTWIGNYMLEYNIMYPKNEIFVFSRLSEEKAFEKVKNLKRITLDDDFLDANDEDPFTSEDFKNTLVIFDDVDTLHDEKIKKIVINLRDDLLETGRRYNINMCITNHIILNYNKTRTLINEATHYVFFKGVNKMMLTRFLKEYIGISSKDDLNKIFTLPSRWTLISKTYPSYIMYSSGAFITN